jgi:hypothetical protein
MENDRHNGICLRMEILISIVERWRNEFGDFNVWVMSWHVFTDMRGNQSFHFES